MDIVLSSCSVDRLYCTTLYQPDSPVSLPSVRRHSLSLIQRLWYSLSETDNKVKPLVCEIILHWINTTGATSWAGTANLPEHLSSPPVFSGVNVIRCVCFVDRCLSFCTFKLTWPKGSCELLPSLGVRP